VRISRNNKSDPFTITGNGKQVRDVLYSSDLIDCYFSAIESVDKCGGEIFNIGGGVENSLSLLELFDILEKELDIKMEYEELPPRKSDQKFFVADIQKAKEYFSWTPRVDKLQGIRHMIKWVQEIIS
jgi:CDP-paratose 2-epimerase